MGARHRSVRSGVWAYCDEPVFPAGSPEARANPSRLATKDHVLPQLWRAPGNGVTTVRNIVSACRGCNEVKGAYPEEPFRFFLAQTRGTALFKRAEFERFIFGLALAGFRAAHRDASARLPILPPPPPAPRGRFTRRDLRRGAA